MDTIKITLKESVHNVISFASHAQVRYKPNVNPVHQIMFFTIINVCLIAPSLIITTMEIVVYASKDVVHAQQMKNLNAPHANKAISF